MIPEALLWLVLNVYHESRGEPDIAQQAIVHVTLNRNHSETTIKKVVKAKGQFSWTRSKKKLRARPWLNDPNTFLQCSLNTLRALRNKDVTNGATYYHDITVKPKWTKGMVLTKRLGKFMFYKEKDGTRI